LRLRRQLQLMLVSQFFVNRGGCRGRI